MKADPLPSDRSHQPAAAGGRLNGSSAAQDPDDATLYRAFVEALPGIAMILDEGGTYVRIMSTGKGRPVGASSDLVGRHVSDVMPSESADRIMAAIEAVIATGEAQLVEYKIHTPETVHWFEGRVVNFNNPVPMGKRQVIWLAHNITERKVAEQDLLERSEELKQFAYVASHDLQSPLHTIQQLTEWLRDDCSETMSDEGKHFVDLIEARSTRMSGLVNGLLTFATTSSKISFEAVNVNPIVQAALEMVVPEDCGFSFEVEPYEPTVNTDSTLLHQIIQNLLGNAIKHHDRDDGQIAVRFERVKDGHWLRIRDDGPGIEQSDRDRIFEIFQTVRGRDEVEGSGMGLAIVKKAVGAFGGEVVVDSDGKTYTEFQVFLPDDPAAARAARIRG